MEVKEESGLKFGFREGSNVIKFDDTEFYRKSFNTFSASKGVDFIVAEKGQVAFIEVKNCIGDEGNCRWRIFPHNQKRDSSRTQLNAEASNKK